MKINFSPVRSDSDWDVIVLNDKITINGVEYDFSPLPEGATLPSGSIECDWIVGDVTRDVDGEIHLTLIRPHPAKASHEDRFPEPITISDGFITRTFDPIVVDEEEVYD